MRLLLVSFLLLVMAGCAATQSPALPASLTPAPLPDSVFTSKDMQRRVEQHPAEYKLIIDQDTAVLFAYPHPIGDWVGPIFVVHIPSVSEVVLDWDGKLAFEQYGSDAGRKSIGQVLANTELVQRAQTRASEIWGRPTATPDMTPSPSSEVSDDTAGWATFTSSTIKGKPIRTLVAV